MVFRNSKIGAFRSRHLDVVLNTYTFKHTVVSTYAFDKTILLFWVLGVLTRKGIAPNSANNIHTYIYMYIYIYIYIYIFYAIMVVFRNSKLGMFRSLHLDFVLNAYMFKHTIGLRYEFDNAI